MTTNLAQMRAPSPGIGHWIKNGPDRRSFKSSPYGLPFASPKEPDIVILVAVRAGIKNCNCISFVRKTERILKVISNDWPR